MFVIRLFLSLKNRGSRENLSIANRELNSYPLGIYYFSILFIFTHKNDYANIMIINTVKTRRAAAHNL